MKATLVLLFAALFSVAFASDYERTFTQWMHKYSRSYDSSEFQTRFAAFKSNADFVSSWNSAEMGFEVELNQFADMSNEEYRRVYLGLKTEVKAERVVGMTQPEVAAPEADSVDWRSKGYVTGIKDQGQCGSCWSFSTTGSTEGAHFKKTGKLVSLSEQQLVDCSGSFGNNGCDGGLMDNAFKYIIKNGIVLESAYPYTAEDGTCSLSGKTTAATLSTYKDVSKSESALVSAISTVGPISVAIDASHSSFQLYKSGVYYEKSCSSTALDHGVLAVGYGASGSSDYYIVKNSWGTSWGQEGYINMARNKNNNCGIATMASYPVA